MTATGTEVGTDAGGRSGRWRWAAAAAAVAGLVAGGLVVQAATMDGDSPGVSALAIDLDSVAGRVGASYQPLGPGQFRYVEVHAWWYRTVPSRPGLRYLAENRQETWIPANEIDTWLHRRDVTGRRKWITGSEAEARKVKYPSGSKISDPFWEPADQDGVWKARCGEFFGIGMLRPDGTCPGGSWSIPTQAWAARAPRDPAKILAQLRADSIKNNGRGDIEILNVAADSLRTGRLPADLQAALFRALALIPGLTITNKLANADGRVGAGYGIDDGRTRFDLILDPKTGEFIGEREVITRDGDIEGPRGTVIDHTAVAAKVVGALGAAR